MIKPNQRVSTHYPLGPMTNPGEHATLYDLLPGSLSGLVEVVQGILLHMHWAEAYGVTLTEERKEEAGIRPVERQLSRPG